MGDSKKGSGGGVANQRGRGQTIDAMWAWSCKRAGSGMWLSRGEAWPVRGGAGRGQADARDLVEVGVVRRAGGGVVDEKGRGFKPLPPNPAAKGSGVGCSAAPTHRGHRGEDPNPLPAPPGPPRVGSKSEGNARKGASVEPMGVEKGVGGDWEQ